MAKLKARQKFAETDRGRLFTPRFVVAIALVLLGIAWIVYYYVVVRVDPTAVPPDKAGSPAFMADLIWICTFYVISGNNLSKVPVFNDLDQFNLLVGIGIMAVGFAFATKWE